MAYPLLLGKCMDAIGIGGSVTIGSIWMASAAVPTEQALKRTFDPQGNCRT